MEILLEDIGRRFNRDWIFRNINYSFKSGSSYAILGPNGSGKSTLLQVISGSLTPSIGKLSYLSEGKELDIETVFSQLSLAAPYLELIEEFTLSEQVDFHFGFKKYRSGLTKKDLIGLAELEKSQNKAIKYFSSGMKQRIKLALAACSDTPVLLLDEPTSNLDVKGIDWYLRLIENFTDGRLTVVCSNQEHEYGFCKNRLDVMDFKGLNPA